MQFPELRREALARIVKTIVGLAGDNDRIDGRLRTIEDSRDDALRVQGVVRHLVHSVRDVGVFRRVLKFVTWDRRRGDAL